MMAVDDQGRDDGGLPYARCQAVYHQNSVHRREFEVRSEKQDNQPQAQVVHGVLNMILEGARETNNQGKKKARKVMQSVLVSVGHHIGQQEEDRAHRIGQKKEVLVFVLVSVGSIEEEIMERAKQ
ncbi:hypothetical protein FRX31_023121 [Thalictrum thalictroides]|uniref:Uncharacterized protein n=1 Tax=Thalictrum thalictroides TaxID=46969 RepID=A0A7J6VSF8_THATH|nr:hypothetical protein FRX31_023121 [Thalictrum thalictroides]